MLADVFEIFRDMCLQIDDLDPANSFSPPGLAWQADSKNLKVKVVLSTDIDMLLMVAEGI